MQENINKNSALFVLCLSAFLVPFMGSAINLALPMIGKSLNMHAISLTWISTSYLITTAVFQVPFARFADLIGRKKVFVIGLFLFSLSTFLCGLASSGFFLILFRSLSGLGSAMIFGTSMAILTSVFQPHERGKAIGINTAVVYFALASGPFLGGMMTHYWGWQSLFLTSGILGAGVIVYALFFLKGEWIESKGESFDYTGSFIYAAGLFGLIFGFSRLPHPLSFLLIALGILAFIAFIFFELKQKQPVFNVRIFSGNKTFSLSSVSALINYASISAVAFMMSLYLQYVRGFDAQHAGLVLIVQAVLQAVISLYAGKWSDKVNPAVLATAGMTVIVVGLTGLIFISASTSIIFLLFLLTLLGIGFGMFSSPNSNVIMSSVEKKYLSQASATMGTMRLTGQAFSMGIAMMAISLCVGNKVITPELHPHFMKSLHMTFVVCAVLCIVGTYASSFRIKKMIIRCCT
ncbi:Multidrug resistance protein Stp [termite gut metagenome]|uniref:Multidrug resistance protein Stp n=1 Tax=termite gut metagenome TaxID=433724 RepID=A0A5J4QEY5_9ZZZZ